jgi:antitoxin MazE
MSRTRVQKWGNSLALRIPKSEAENLGLVAGSEVTLSASRGALVARPAARRPRLSDLVKAITTKNRHAGTDWGSPAGREVW